MPQFLIQSGTKVGEIFSLAEDEAHHLRDVQRHKLHETVQVTDGAKAYYAQIVELGKFEVKLRLLSEIERAPKKGSLEIAQALLKKDKMEWILEKSVELGVDRLQPFTSSRTIAEKESSNKRERWEKIIEASVKQCGSPTRPTLQPTLTLEKLLEECTSDYKIIFWEEGGIKLNDFFHALKNKGIELNARVTLLIGPEGGFSKEEVTLANQSGFTSVFLGSSILRAETAAITGASLVQYELGNL